EPWRQETLLRHVAALDAGLAALRFSLGPTQSPIIPVMIGDSRLTMAACRYLLRHGIFVQGIRPPAGPQGTARLRLVPIAPHTHAQIDSVLQAFAGLATILKKRQEVFQ